jgi:hypothetical protein
MTVRDLSKKLFTFESWSSPGTKNGISRNKKSKYYLKIKTFQNFNLEIYYQCFIIGNILLQKNFLLQEFIINILFLDRKVKNFFYSNHFLFYSDGKNLYEIFFNFFVPRIAENSSRIPSRYNLLGFVYICF